MSHRKLLMQRINDAIEAGAYRAPGTPRVVQAEPAKATRDEEDQPAPKLAAQPAKQPEASSEVKRSTPDPKSFVEGLAMRRRDEVGEGVHKALDAKFKGKR